MEKQHLAIRRCVESDFPPQALHQRLSRPDVILENERPRLLGSVTCGNGLPVKIQEMAQDALVTETQRRTNRIQYCFPARQTLGLQPTENLRTPSVGRLIGPFVGFVSKILPPIDTTDPMHGKIGEMLLHPFRAPNPAIVGSIQVDHECRHLIEREMHDAED